MRWQSKPAGASTPSSSVSAPASAGVTLSQRISACARATGSQDVVMPLVCSVPARGPRRESIVDEFKHTIDERRYANCQRTPVGWARARAPVLGVERCRPLFPGLAHEGLLAGRHGPGNTILLDVGLDEGDLLPDLLA